MKQLSILLILYFGLFSSSTISQELYMYVSDAGNFNNPPWQILRYDVDGTNPIVFIDQELAWPQDILFLEDQGVVLISNITSGRITKYHADTGVFISDFATVAGGPTRMTIGPDNLIYVLQWSNTNNKVLRFEQDGTPLGEFTSVGVVQSIGMDWDSAGNFYVSSYGQGSVRKFDNSGNDLGIYVSAELSGPTNIWFDFNNNLYVLDWNAGDVEKYDENGVYAGTFISGLSQPEGVDFLSSGNILIGNGGLGEIKQYQSNGTFVENTVTSGFGGLNQPNAVVLRYATFGVEDEGLINNLISPTIGSSFQIVNPPSNSLKNIQIFNISGGLIATLDPLKVKVWDANNQAEGIYFMVATTANGNRATQRLLVSHN